MNIFLAGASGFVGSRVLEDLLAVGHEVVALAHSDRSLKEIARAHPNATVVQGDVSRPEDMLRAIPSGTEAVVYLPGLLREIPRKSITFRAVHVEGVRNVLAAAKQAGVARWIQMSALGARADTTLKYYRTKWEGEELVRASGLAWTILHPSLIFDDRPRREHNFVQEIAKAIRISPFVPILGDGTFLFQPVSVDDVSQTIVQSLAMPETIGKTYDIGGPEKIHYRELVSTIARAMGTKKPKIKIPFWLITSIARLFRSFSWFPITLDELEMLRNGNFVRDPNEDKQWRDTFDVAMKRFCGRDF
jgi:uncharacterized protein YbjT (DUF2867 family)